MLIRIKFILLLAIVSTFSIGSLTAQIERATIMGSLKDSQSNEGLFGAYVVIKGNEGKGVLSDIDGNYKIEVQPGTITLIYKLIGYDPIESTFTLSPNEIKRFDVKLQPDLTLLKTFVTTAGKFEQNIEELTVSLEVLKPNIIENKNTTTMDDALQQVPGVAIVDGEPQIRSGSGYSFGAGSRVMILMDDLPILSGDAGRPSWGFLPTENVEQVEVIKGASSVLYGSAALSGVINIRTAYPRDKPQTKVNVFTGIYNNPRNKDGIYWGSNNPGYTGINFFHSQKFGNLDVVIGGNAFYDAGYVGPTPVDVKDTTFNKFAEQRGEFENRVRLNFSLRYRSKKIEGLSYGVNANGMLSRSASSLLWFSADSGMYRGYPGSNTLTLQDVSYVDPFIHYVGKRGWSHSLKNRWFHLNNDNDNNQSNKSNVYYSEYQVQREFKSGYNFTSGLVHSLSQGTSDLYKGNVVDTTNTQASSSNRNIAAYLQIGKTYFKRLTISAGARYEHFSIQSPRISDTAAVSSISEGRPVFRAGANLKILKATFLRASFGQGYRFPTIAEKFIKTAVGPIRIYPNDSITSETSWNVEVGLKQGFKIGNFLGYADVAWFQQNFTNNIEFNFGQFGTFADPLFGLGFASLNIGDTKVSGVDVSVAGQGKIGKNTISLLTGYTHTVPVALEPNKPYPVQLKGEQLTYSTSSSDSTGYLLKYRFQHLFKADIEVTRGKWIVGFSSRYNSNMQNIDKIFEDLDFILGGLGLQKPGLKDYRASHTKGFTIFDVRIAFKLSETSRIAFVVNNLTNEQYSIRPLKIEAPRTTAIQLNLNF
jgi:outer membrane receptor protein involved in Fe transport